MVLAVDIGNTHTVFGIFKGGNPVDVFRISSEELSAFDFQKENRTNNVKSVVVSSVVPGLNPKFAQKVKEGKKTILWVTPQTAKIPLRVDYPEEVGADRLCNAVAAWEKYKQATIVVDFGTATTLDVITERGEYGGGAIAPGLHLAHKSLVQAAARLEEVPIEKPKRVVGRNTVECMQSGLYYGYVGMIDHLVRLTQKEEGYPMKTVATGGLAPLITQDSKMIEKTEPNLTLEGLYFIWKRNN